MRRSSLSLLAAAVLAGACTGLRPGAGAPRPAGAYSAALTITGRSTYTGTFTVGAWRGDSLFAALALTAPLAVDVSVAGRRRGDTLVLHGSYTAANGCTGTMEASVAAIAPLRGPFTLADRCVGTLAGTMELRR